ncbi:MAG: aminotransferase [Acidobacteria bacterium]|nr:MAG: aminotransferase [Acidobacteriota bacterium]
MLYFSYQMGGANIMKSLLASHAKGKIKPDAIFGVGAKAKEAKAAFGAEKVIDGSIGILLDDQGELALLPSVEKATAMLKPENIAPYAPICGTPEYRGDVVSYLFGKESQILPTGAVATAGATGALRLAVWNFLEPGDVLITHDYYWGPYGTMARDALRELETFATFTESGDFNVNACLKCTEEVLNRQGRALVIINTPCHNPTGMSLKHEELISLKKGLDELCLKNPEKPLVLLFDVAYWEFEEPERNQLFLSQFVDMPDNFVFCMAYSISKSLTRYGFRTGALVVRCREQAALNEIIDTMRMSIRSMWSNSPRIGQAVFSTIFRSDELRAQLAAEQRHFANLCNSRGHAFVKEARACGLQTTPYAGGFFVTIPCANSKAVSDRLFKRRIFLVPMKKGVRVAFCAIPTHQISGLAEKIRAALE